MPAIIGTRPLWVVFCFTGCYHLTGSFQAGTRRSVPIESDSVCTVGSELSHLGVGDVMFLSGQLCHRNRERLLGLKGPELTREPPALSPGVERPLSKLRMAAISFHF